MKPQAGTRSLAPGPMAGNRGENLMVNLVPSPGLPTQGFLRPALCGTCHRWHVLHAEGFTHRGKDDLGQGW
jgi:hypothetical protein